ncbi:hypothetical protein [Spiroplasma poulsonii]|uniref:hypothetical protein n=1 Tax=Spiroplasma poulsonii TaxID=2138 RepID=UPI001F4C9E1D|nr:hypothetical protein [Spiroplasma poulsonii]UNF61651.1 hypothetical protein MNU24_06995 [Spiroplasma poulsonii]
MLIEIQSSDVYGKLEEVLRNMLTYRYNYDRKFYGAKFDEKGNPINESAKPKQLFEGQKPENVIDGLFEKNGAIY